MKHHLATIASLLICMLFLPLAGSYNHSHDEEIALLEKAEKQLQKLNEALSEHIRKRGELTKKNEAYLKDADLWNEVIEGDALFIKSVEKLQGDFLIFRESLRRTIYDSVGQSPYGRSLSASCMANVTEWYASYLQEMLLTKEGL